MSPEKLVYMANQIGRFFAHQPEEQAVASIADHLKKFWDPRMRKTIIDHVAHGAADLQPLPLKAVRALATLAQPVAADAKKS